MQRFAGVAPAALVLSLVAISASVARAQTSAPAPLLPGFHRSP